MPLTIHALLRSLNTANAPLLMLCVPIAMAGRRWGSRPGLGTAALALALVGMRAWIYGGPIGVVGYLSRATAFVMVAHLAGTVHELQDRDEQNAAARVAAPGTGLASEASLSPRELEVLAALAEGATNAEIAERLFIAETTVQSHIKSIFRKLGARNRTEAAAWYLRESLRAGSASRTV